MPTAFRAAYAALGLKCRLHGVAASRRSIRYRHRCRILPVASEETIMTTAARASTPLGLAGMLLAAACLLSACGDGTQAPGTAGNAVASAYVMRPVGTVGEADARLFEAAGRGDRAGVEQAAAAGANVGATDKLKRTPLFGAAFLNQAETAELLVERGADVNAKDISGFTPLHAGVVAGGKEVVAALIARGAGINARAAGGWTPLHLAAATDQPAMVDLLLQSGADPRAKGSEGLTPAALAARNGHSAVSARIKKWVEARNASPK